MPEILRIAGILAVVVAATVAGHPILTRNDFDLTAISVAVPIAIGGAMIWAMGEAIVLLRRIADSVGQPQGRPSSAPDAVDGLPPAAEPPVVGGQTFAPRGPWRPQG